MRLYVIIELGVVEHIVESYGTAHFCNGSDGALHALVFSVKFVDQIVALYDPLATPLLLLGKKHTHQYGADYRYSRYKERGYKLTLLM